MPDRDAIEGRSHLPNRTFFAIDESDSLQEGRFVKPHAFKEPYREMLNCLGSIEPEVGTMGPGC